MIRLVEFRGKENGEWIYGGIFSPEPDKVFIITDDGKQHPVDRGTVGQWTGMFDKKYRKLYEGDFVEIQMKSGWNMLGVLKYNQFQGYWYVYNRENKCPAYDVKEFDYFGNIVEDPQTVEALLIGF